MKKVILPIILSIILLGLTGCMDAVCIDADDFGFSQVKVPASYATSSIHGSGDSQYADWYDSGLTLSGNDVHMVVKNWDMLKNINSADELSAWCPWLGPASQAPSLQDICMMLDTCNFNNNDMCTANPKSVDDAYILNAPCLLRKGVGLYVLLAPRGFNPNSSSASSQTPQKDSTYGNQVIVKHLGNPPTDATGGAVQLYDLQIDPQAGTSEYQPAGGAYIPLSTSDALNLTGGKLWFKILDKYYPDNSGQYIVTIKSGVTTLEWDPTAFATTLVKSFFFGAEAVNGSPFAMNGDGIIVMLFNNIIRQPSYKLAVSSLLTLAIIYYAINFLIGNVRLTHHDLLMRILKIIIISQLLSGSAAWDFFYDYLFVYFIQGSQGLMSLVSQAGGSGPGASSIISFMLAPQTLIKLFSLPMLSWTTFGFSLIYISVYIFALGIVLFGLMYSAVIYILCLVMMGLLIALAPIFLCFMLFDQTRSLFDTWLKQLMSYALQPLIVVAGVTMFGLMIRHQIYQTLGFRVCKNFWLSSGKHQDNALTTNIRGNADRSSQAYYWAPQYVPGVDPNNLTNVAAIGERPISILIPEAHYQDVNNANINSYLAINDPSAIFCQAYGCAGLRYPSFPFLDYNYAPDYNLLQGFWSGNFAPFSSLGIFLICGLLIQRFNLQATNIAQYITGGSFSVSKSAMSTLKDMKGNVQAAVKGASYIKKKIDTHRAAVKVKAAESAEAAKGERSKVQGDIGVHSNKEETKENKDKKEEFTMSQNPMFNKRSLQGKHLSTDQVGFEKKDDN